MVVDNITRDEVTGELVTTMDDGTEYRVPLSDGVDGVSTYQSWLDAGNTGSEATFLASLVGEDGINGSDGLPGKDGPAGKSAYQSYVDTGGTLSEADWISQQATQADIANAIANDTTTIDGSRIVTGTIDASRVNVINVVASSVRAEDITSGTLKGMIIEGASISGSAITSSYLQRTTEFDKLSSYTTTEYPAGVPMLINIIGAHTPSSVTIIENDNNMGTIESTGGYSSPITAFMPNTSFSTTKYTSTPPLARDEYYPSWTLFGYTSPAYTTHIRCENQKFTVSMNYFEGFVAWDYDDPNPTSSVNLTRSYNNVIKIDADGWCNTDDTIEEGLYFNQIVHHNSGCYLAKVGRQSLQYAYAGHNIYHMGGSSVSSLSKFHIRFNGQYEVLSVITGESVTISGITFKVIYEPMTTVYHDQFHWMTREEGYILVMQGTKEITIPSKLDNLLSVEVEAIGSGIYVKMFTDTTTVPAQMAYASSKTNKPTVPIQERWLKIDPYLEGGGEL
jgi:hypothetical protein